MLAEQTLKTIERCGLVAVMRGHFPPPVALRVADVLVEEGIPALEFTMNSAQAVEAMQAVKARFGGDVLVGMGTVLDTEMAGRALDGGAEMIVSPAFTEDVVALVHAHNTLMIPGIITPSEAVDAWTARARALKVFPIGPLGVDYFKALRAPLDHMTFMCNGGTDDTNVGAFLRAGAIACGMAGWLTGDGTTPLETIRERARRLRAIVDDARAG